MTTHLVTFSDESMSRSRELCVQSARHHGVKIVHEYEPSGVASAFIGYDAIWNNPKGCGLWAWKPMIISGVLNSIGITRTQFNLTHPDYIIYADAGIEFVNNVNHIIDRMGHEKRQDDIWLFGNNWEHHHWCKQSVIEVIWPVRGVADVETRMKLDCQRFGKQCQASVIFFRVSEYSRAFVAEWLKWCLWNNGELIDDSPSWIGNHPEFREHRHDQAILTTLAYREGIKLHYWPAVYNKGGTPEFVYEKLPEYAGDDYPVLFSHHRKRDNEWQ
jgi:hypothetical protein